MKIKTSELTRLALSWAVAQCEGRADPIYRYGDEPHHFYISGPQRQGPYDPPTDWSQGGPIIDRMQLNRLTTNVGGGYTASVKVTLINTDGDAYMVWKHGSGPTLLIAAMRCRVASKLGDEVDVPAELLTE